MKKVLLFYCLLLPASFGSAAVETFNPIMFIPNLPSLVQSQPTYSTIATIDASGEKFGYVFTAPKTGNIIRFGARTNAAIGSWSLQASLQSIGTTGNPSGSFLCANSSSTISGTSAAEWVYASSFTAGCAVVAGSSYTAVIEATATPVTVLWAGLQDWSANFPYHVSSTSASGYVKSAAGPIFALVYDDGTIPFLPNTQPIETVTTIAVSTSSTPNVVGNRFRFPQDTVVWGAWLWADLDANGDIVVMNDASTVIYATVTVSSATRVATGAEIGYYQFASTFTLTGDTYYRLALRNHTSTGINFYRLEYDSQALFNATANYGADMVFTSARDPNELSDWTEVSYAIATIGLMVSGFDTGGSGGGTSAVPFVQ